MLRQMDFRWRYQPRKTVDVQLMKYIQSNLMMGKTQMMLLAVRSFLQNSRELNYQSATNNSENNLYDDAGLSNFM